MRVIEIRESGKLPPMPRGAYAYCTNGRRMIIAIPTVFESEADCRREVKDYLKKQGIDGRQRRSPIDELLPLDRDDLDGL